jgi:hypothetical protein
MKYKWPLFSWISKQILSFYSLVAAYRVISSSALQNMTFRIVFWDVLHLWNVGRQSFYTAVHPRRQFWTSYSPPWELEISHYKTYGSFVYAWFVQSLSNTYECIGDFRFSLCCSIDYRNYWMCFSTHKRRYFSPTLGILKWIIYFLTRKYIIIRTLCNHQIDLYRLF